MADGDGRQRQPNRLADPGSGRTPNRAGHRNGRAHHVQNVHFQEVRRRRRTRRARTTAGETGTHSRISASRAAARAATPRRSSGPRRTCAAAASASTDAGKKQEQRRRHARDHDDAAVPGTKALGRQRPGVEGVGADHDEDRDAAEPVDVGEPGRRAGRGHSADGRRDLEGDVLPEAVPYRAGTCRGRARSPDRAAPGRPRPCTAK